MKDIETYEDCKALVDGFYDRARRDALLGPVFESRIAGRWDEHLERMACFWTSVLFAVPLYAGKPLDRHMGLPIGGRHFSRWVDLWTDEVARRFSGERADIAKRAALKMSERMGVALGA